MVLIRIGPLNKKKKRIIKPEAILDSSFYHLLITLNQSKFHFFLQVLYSLRYVEHVLE